MTVNRITLFVFHRAERVDRLADVRRARAQKQHAEVVADIVGVIRDSGLPNETNAMFTNIEGEWDEVMAVVAGSLKSNLVFFYSPSQVAAKEAPSAKKTDKERKKRDREAHAIPEWEELRQLASDIKEHTLTHLGDYLEEFERNAIKNGAQVHWAKDAAEHRWLEVAELAEGLSR